MDGREDGPASHQGVGEGEGEQDLGSVGVADPPKRVVHLKGMDNLQLGMLIAMAPRLARMVGKPGAAVVFEEDGSYYLEFDSNVIEWDGENKHLAAKG